MTTSPSPSVPERLVVNTGPLITLGRVGALEIIGRLPLEMLTPQEVAREVRAGAALGHPVEVPGWLTVCALTGPVSPLATQALACLAAPAGWDSSTPCNRGSPAWRPPARTSTPSW